MKARRTFAVVFLMLFATSLLLAENEQPLPSEPPPECSEECLEALDPYFRSALWYYEAYLIEKEASEKKNDLVAQIEEELREAKRANLAFVGYIAALLGITIWYTTTHP